ncbi:4-(cytidine 5'-diphospho)-2-C-methyl-D-erythritol kinase [SAR202 cluster bacterium AD-804-J14_MRT_500m]|nr:4-(cytidine 5'-diphospho)-2-C-methyl-D-erythritol kinase [SAR202 cluster bacterium AD-804-J14_MRT_500m]
MGPSVPYLLGSADRHLKTVAYAKINLSLEVLGPRPDGYHQVITILQTVDLFDHISFKLDDQLDVHCSAAGLEGEDNLVWHAASLLQNTMGKTGLSGAKIQIHKGIPVSMGLGGGSSDAAATLVSLNRLWGLDKPHESLHEIARDLGVDVPFFLRGGTALGVERGDDIHWLKALGKRWLVLVCPEIFIENKTARLYGMLSPESYTDGSLTTSLAQSISRGECQSELLFNVFEQVALEIFPGLGEVMEDMNDAGAKFVHLSGSGPALFSLVESPREGQQIVNRLSKMGRISHLLRTTGASSVLTVKGLSN